MLLGTTAREVSGIKFLRQRVVDDISRRVVRRQRSGSTVGCSCHVPHGAASRRDFCTREFVGFSSGLSKLEQPRYHPKITICAIQVR